MKNKDKKLVQYEIEARKAKRAEKDFKKYEGNIEGYVDDFCDLLFKKIREGVTEEEQKELERLANASKYTIPYMKEKTARNLEKVKQAQEEDLEAKRKRFERAMKAAADKKKKEQEKTE